MGDILADLQRVNAELDAMPPLLLAVRLHPADASVVRRMATRALTPAEHFGAVDLFVSTRATRGTPDYAYDRETIARWQEQEGDR